MNIDDAIGLNTVSEDQADRRLSVRFSLQPRLDNKRTEEEGREVYKDVEYVTILIPGDKTLTVNRPVQPSDRVRFAAAYQAFKQRQGEAIVGTPLSVWPLVTESQRRELEYFNVRTVEQLAELNDNLAGSMMGVQGIKQAAQKFLAAQREQAPTVKLMKELSERDSRIAALEDQIQKLAAKLSCEAPPEPESKPSNSK